MALIYHITGASDWAQARQDGAYRLSTLGRSLADEGFIHASTAPQVAPVANAFYQEASDLLVLFIDTDRVQPEIRYEQVPGSADPFPHIYGPLNTDAVVQAIPLERDASGLFTFATG
jgi:uncharacterized protein (DUF952 family)